MKHTQTDLFSQSMIETKTLYAVEKALKKFGGEPFDLILHTPGGEVFATQLLSTVLRAYPGRIRAIVPVYAMSGGTFLALSCDELLLGETACLGPVDPQVGSLFSQGSARAWQEVVRRKGRRADDFSIQMAFLGKQYTQTLERTVDDLLARKVPDPAVRARAVERLTSGEVEHGRPLTVADLWGLGIPVQPLDGRAKALMLDLLTAKNIEGVYAL
jgi:ClpP class serine protease